MSSDLVERYIFTGKHRVFKIESTETSYNLTGLQPATRFGVSVAAKTKAGVSSDLVGRYVFTGKNEQGKLVGHRGNDCYGVSYSPVICSALLQ